jgi:hypothetical protein
MTDGSKEPVMKGNFTAETQSPRRDSQSLLRVSRRALCVSAVKGHFTISSLTLH